MSDSVTTTTSMSDSVPTANDPKALWRTICDMLKIHFQQVKSEFYHEEHVYKVFERELERFKNLDGGPSTNSIDTLKKMLANVKAKFPRSLATDGANGKSPLQEWVDTLSMQKGKDSYNIQTWNPVEIEDLVLATVRALESPSGPSQETSAYASDLYNHPHIIGVSIGKLSGKGLPDDAVKVIEEMYTMVRGSGNDRFVELHSENARKEWPLKIYDDFKRLNNRLYNILSNMI